MARRTALRQEFIDIASDLYARGFTYDEILRATGVPARTFYQWLEKGRAGKQPYSQLVHELEKARVDRWRALLGIIEAAASKSWQAAAWLLERECPSRWASPEVRLRHALGDEQVEIGE